MPGPAVTNPSHGFFPLDAIDAQRRGEGVAFLEFLRTPVLSLGLDVLEPGAGAPANTHTEDEIYVVLEGESRFEAGAEDQPVGPGAMLYVKRGVPHRFHAITKRMKIVVVFAPPYESLAR